MFYRISIQNEHALWPTTFTENIWESSASPNHLSHPDLSTEGIISHNSNKKTVDTVRVQDLIFDKHLGMLCLKPILQTLWYLHP